jgi:hypothetical protein
MGTRIQAIRRWWKDTPDPVRWVAYICLPLGALTLGLGVYGDGHGWWDHRGFLTNLMSSFTSLLFGVPTALFVLGSLGDAQNQARARRRLRSAVKAEARQFETVLIQRFNADTAAELKQKCRDILQGAEEAHDRGEDLDPFRQRVFDLGTVRTDHDEEMSESQQERRRMQAAEDWLRRTRAQWDIIDNELRPRALEAGTEWIPSLWSSHIREYLAYLHDRPADPSKQLSAFEHCEMNELLAAAVLRLQELYP